MKKLSAISYPTSPLRGLRRDTSASGTVALIAVVLLAVWAPVVAHAGDAQQALQWLQSAQRTDGSWCEKR